MWVSPRLVLADSCLACCISHAFAQQQNPWHMISSNGNCFQPTKLQSKRKGSCLSTDKDTPSAVKGQLLLHPQYVSTRLNWWNNKIWFLLKLGRLANGQEIVFWKKSFSGLGFGGRPCVAVVTGRCNGRPISASPSYNNLPPKCPSSQYRPFCNPTPLYPPCYTPPYTSYTCYQIPPYLCGLKKT